MTPNGDSIGFLIVSGLNRVQTINARFEPQSGSPNLGISAGKVPVLRQLDLGPDPGKVPDFG